MSPPFSANYPPHQKNNFPLIETSSKTGSSEPNLSACGAQLPTLTTFSIYTHGTPAKPSTKTSPTNPKASIHHNSIISSEFVTPLKLGGSSTPDPYDLFSLYICNSSLMSFTIKSPTNSKTSNHHNSIISSELPLPLIFFTFFQ